MGPYFSLVLDLCTAISIVSLNDRSGLPFLDNCPNLTNLCNELNHWVLATPFRTPRYRASYVMCTSFVIVLTHIISFAMCSFNLPKITFIIFMDILLSGKALLAGRSYINGHDVVTQAFTNHNWFRRLKYGKSYSQFHSKPKTTHVKLSIAYVLNLRYDCKQIRASNLWKNCIEFISFNYSPTCISSPAQSLSADASTK